MILEGKCGETILDVNGFHYTDYTVHVFQV